MKINPNDSAMPTTTKNYLNQNYVGEGLTKREKLIFDLYVGLISVPNGCASEKGFAKYAIKAADILLSEMNKDVSPQTTDTENVSQK